MEEVEEVEEVNILLSTSSTSLLLLLDTKMHPRELLARHDIHAKKSLGQNFLYDEALLRRIVDSAEISSADNVLEIGPGLGSMTREIAKVAKRVAAVELDDRLMPILRYELAHFDNVELIHNDILKVEPATLFDKPYTVIANVPYYITGAILRHLSSATVKPNRMVITMQQEVAERVCAKPGKLSLLAVGVQFYGTPRIMMNIGSAYFWPRPKVASSVLRIDFSDDTPTVDEKTFFRIAKVGFSQKRKQLKNNMRGLGLSKEQVASLFQSAGIDGMRRAETITIPEWASLTAAFETISNG